MTHPQRNHEEPCSSFTITQLALGSPLQFEPALGSQELDNLINNYVHGSALTQQKRAQVVLEFLNSIDALSYTHPVSIRYYVPQVLTPQIMPRNSSMPSLKNPPVAASYVNNPVQKEALGTSKSTGSLKRSREEVAPPNTSNAKRLPGFSIMTRDGIDITDLASRGPKTKEQRDHAALMRKLKACAACKKSKQRCDPSHHRPAQSAPSTSSSATPSTRSARLSCISSVGGSRESISPQSSLGESFSQSPTQSFMDRAIAQTGQSFPPLPTAKPSLSPSDFTLPDTLLADSTLSALPTQDFDPEFFQFADTELDSWNADFTTFPPVDNKNTWNNHEDIFASNYCYNISPVPKDGNSLEQVLPRQDQGQLLRLPGQTVRDTVCPGSHESDFDIDQWLYSAKDQHRNDSLPQRAAQGAASDTAIVQIDMLRHKSLRRGLQNPVLPRDQDYILYPDSPQIEWGLEPHLISRDIGDMGRLQREGAGYETTRNRHIDASQYQQESQRSESAGGIIPDSNDHALGVQSTQLLGARALHHYLPSPSPSECSGYSTGNNVSDSISSEIGDTAYDTQNSLTRCSTQSNYAQSHLNLYDLDQLNVVQHPSNASVSGTGEVDGYHSAVRPRPLSPGQSQNLRSVIPADVNVGFQRHSDEHNHTQFARPQGSPSELPMPDTQSQSMNILYDQQAQQTIINQESQAHALQVNPQDWDHIWKERDLRRAGLLGAPAEGRIASRLCVSSYDRSRMQANVDDTYDAISAEARQQSWRAKISSDLPGEDEKKYISSETLTQQREVPDQGNSQPKDTSLPEGPEFHQAQQEYSPTLSRSMVSMNKRMTTIITLCMLMTISLLWTISLLMATGNNRLVSSIAKQRDTAALRGTETEVARMDSENDVRSISFGLDSGSPCQSSSGPGLDENISKVDFLYFGSDHVKDIEPGHTLDTWPEGESLADDSSTSESYSGHYIQQLTPSPTFSSLSVTPAFTVAASTTKCVTTWTTQVPARPTSQPKKNHLPLVLQNQCQSSVRSPDSRILTDLKRTWSRRFNIGHLGTRITSLVIL